MAKLLFEYTLVRRTISPANRTNGTVNGEAIDRAVSGGNHEAIVAIVTGAIAGTHAVTIEDSDDGATGWAAVPADRLRGEVPTIEAAGADSMFEIGVGETRQFLRTSIVTTGTTINGGTVGVVVVLGEMRFSPVVR